MTTPDFASIRQENDYHEPYWSARDLSTLLGYKKWQRFEDVIRRAMDSCRTNGNVVEQHFTPAETSIVGGHGAIQSVKDCFLSKYGCWLIAMNGDPRKPEIAAAQAYFLVSTAEHEMHTLRIHQEQRLMLREKVSEGNKSFFEAASLSGVQSPHFGLFEDAGILGQYTLTTSELEDKRQIPLGELYNTMPPHELAGNLLRITQTDYNLQSLLEFASSQTFNLAQAVELLSRYLQHQEDLEKKSERLDEGIKRLLLAHTLEIQMPLAISSRPSADKILRLPSRSLTG